jgi:hypothetical protein
MLEMQPMIQSLAPFHAQNAY